MMMMMMTIMVKDLLSHSLSLTFSLPPHRVAAGAEVHGTGNMASSMIDLKLTCVSASKHAKMGTQV